MKKSKLHIFKIIPALLLLASTGAWAAGTGKLNTSITTGTAYSTMLDGVSGNPAAVSSEKATALGIGYILPLSGLSAHTFPVGLAMGTGKFGIGASTTLAITGGAFGIGNTSVGLGFKAGNSFAIGLGTDLNFTALSPDFDLGFTIGSGKGMQIGILVDNLQNFADVLPGLTFGVGFGETKKYQVEFDVSTSALSLIGSSLQVGAGFAFYAGALSVGATGLFDIMQSAIGFSATTNLWLGKSMLLGVTLNTLDSLTFGLTFAF